jgi:hypothetical protein
MTDPNLKPGENPKHPDPISKEPAAHPGSVAAGATGGAIAGAAMGSIGGPVGIVAGAAMGAVAGGIAAKVIAEGLDPSVEDAYWGRAFASRPYVKEGESYDAYRDAYRYGWESRNRLAGAEWATAEDELSRGWSAGRGESTLDWEKAKSATKDAWDRMLPHRHEHKQTPDLPKL